MESIRRSNPDEEAEASVMPSDDTSERQSPSASTVPSDAMSRAPVPSSSDLGSKPPQVFSRQQSLPPERPAQHLQFPCIEQPPRVIVSSPDGKSVLSCGKDGTVTARPLSSILSNAASPTTRRASALSQSSTSASAALPQCSMPKITDAEEFTVVPSEDGRVVLKSGGKSGRYLCYDGAFGQGAVVGKTEANIKEIVEEGEEAPTRWRLARKKGGVVLLTEWRHDLHLIGSEETEEEGHGDKTGRDEGDAHEARLSRRCDGTLECISSEEVAVAPNDEQSTFWSMEFRTGELLFLSSPKVDSRIRCGINGELSLSDNWKGWEVWRFAEIGDGTGAVRISSFCHEKKFLVSDNIGGVRTTEEWREEGSRWTVHKARGKPSDDGVVIKSATSGRVLSICGKALHTTPAETAGAFSVWHLETAHRQHYYVSTVGTGQRIGAKASSLYLTKSPVKWRAEEWRVDAIDTTGETVALYSNYQSTYLCSQECGATVLLPHMSESALWRMSEHPEGFRFESVIHGRVLTKRLCTVTADEASQNPASVSEDKFRLDPILPRQVNDTKLKTLGITATVAVGTAVAVPFAIGGAVAALGAAEMTAAAEAIAIGLTAAAETAASVVLVAATARTLMHEVAVGVDDNRDDGLDSGAGDAMNRPFCGWRNW